jgi:enamine deaminase RidA (YjgF/YER057c/UK114 family)
MDGGKPTMLGQLGAEIDETRGQEAARQAVLNALAIAAADLGSLDRVTRVVKPTGYVNSAAGFARQHVVINGASDLLLQIFGEAGRHARTSVGVNTLPFGFPVELDLVLEFSAA